MSMNINIVIIETNEQNNKNKFLNDKKIVVLKPTKV